MKKTILIFGIFLVVFIVLGWFLFISPQLGSMKFKSSGERDQEAVQGPDGERVYEFPIEFETVLKDHKKLTLNMNVVFNDDEGIKELPGKVKKIKYGMYLVFRTYKSNQIIKQKLEKSTLKKIIQSQIRSKVEKVYITELEIL